MLDLSKRPLNANAYDDRPFTFIDPAAQNDLANINAINLIENGDRHAREAWQNRRITTLLKHAQTRSQFWRKRLPSRMLGHGMMKYVPVQSREDVATQVNLEGSLMAGVGNAPILNYTSTGSTGVPVKVYVTPENGYYNVIRSLAQYFINDLSLAENRVQLFPPIGLAKLDKKSQAVETLDAWAGPLSKVFRNGSNKKITHQFDDDALIRELSRSQFGYLVSPSRYLDMLIQKGGLELIKKLGFKLWFHLSDYRDLKIVEALESIGIRSLSNYSAGEIGPIAYECPARRDYFHVAHTNVVVECDDQVTASFNGVSLGRLLVTHLHSYATPLIRYDIGDFGHLEPECPCGHQGPTISSIYGRGKHFVRHPDGRLLPFYFSTRTLLDVLPFTEIRFQQKEIDTILVEVGGRDNITADEESNLRNLIIGATDPAFKVDITCVNEIDWSGNPKRLFFVSSFA